MRIIREVKQKVCADGAFMREVVLDNPATDSFVNYLQNLGPVMALGEIGPGFFKYEFRDGFSIKGWIGDNTIEIRFRREVMDLCEDFIPSLFSYYQDGSPDLKSIRIMEAQLRNRVQMRLHGNGEEKSEHR